MPTDPNLSVSETIARFRDRKKAERNAENGYQELQKFAEWFGGERKVGEVTGESLREYAGKIQEQDSEKEGIHAHRKLQELRLFLIHCDWNPIDLAKCLPLPKSSLALADFEAGKKAKKATKDGYQELRKFVRWSGDREVGKFTPHDMEQYAREVGQSGADSAQRRLQPVKAFVDYWKEQGWISIRLATHLRPPRSRTSGAVRSASPRLVKAMEEGKTYLSQEGYNRLLQQVEDLKAERAGVTEEIRRAMADKDFRENAPLDAAKDRQGRIETQIRELEASIANAEILQEGGDGVITRSTVGARMKVKNKDSGEVVEYTLVDAREADVASRRISIQSPVGQALLDHSIGAEVVIPTPKGTLTYIVQDIS